MKYKVSITTEAVNEEEAVKRLLVAAVHSLYLGARKMYGETADEAFQISVEEVE